MKILLVLAVLAISSSAYGQDARPTPPPTATDQKFTLYTVGIQYAHQPPPHDVPGSVIPIPTTWSGSVIPIPVTWSASVILVSLSQGVSMGLRESTAGRSAATNATTK